jgi:hypothetical protein
MRSPAIIKPTSILKESVPNKPDKNNIGHPAFFFIFEKIVAELTLGLS